MSKKQSLPYDAEVEYLETTKETGSAKIDIPMVITGYDNDLFVKVMLNDFQANFVMIAGSGSTTGNNAYRVSYNQNNQIRFNNGNSLANSIYYTITPGETYDIKLYHDYTYEINGEKGDLKTGKGNDNVDVISLFGITNVTYMRLYSFRWVKGGVTVLDLIPVRKGAEGFMYDKVSGQLFGNSGTGRFIVGPDI